MNRDSTLSGVSIRDKERPVNNPNRHLSGGSAGRSKPRPAETVGARLSVDRPAVVQELESGVWIVRESEQLVEAHAPEDRLDLR